MEQNQTPQIVEATNLDEWFEKAGQEEVQQQEIAQTLESVFEEEKKPEAVEVTPQAVKEEETIIVDDKLTNQVKFLVEKGYWEDYDIEVDDPTTGEKKLVPILDLPMTPELFEQLEVAQKEKKQEDLNSKYISKEGIDATTEKMIELKKAGGDITQLLQVESDFVNPLKNIDLENEQHQEYLVRQRLSLNQDLDEIDIESKIKRLKQNLTLDVEAKKIAEEVQERFDNYVEEKKQEHLLKLEAQKEEQKVFKKTISETYKGFQIKNENLIKALVDSATKTDEYGLADIDKLYFDSKTNNPELFAKAVFLLKNEEAFNEFMGIKIKNKISLDTTKTILKLSPKVARQNDGTQSRKPLDELEAVFEKK
jgi:hypothetical protein